MNDYNRIAWIYDTLARWVFAGDIYKSQTHFLNEIKPNSRILIVGGGSGKVLEALEHLNQPMTVDFIEPAQGMIEKAKHRSAKLHNLDLNFHALSFQSFNSSDNYDYICCFYFLDLFKEQTLERHLNHITELMHKNTRLLVADFQITSGHIWKKLLSTLMHVFFKLTTNLESRRLKDLDDLLNRQGLVRVKKAEYFSQFIFSAVYHKEVSNNGNHL